MNRIRLRLFAPAEEESAERKSADSGADTEVLSFEQNRPTAVTSGRIMAPAERARILRENSVCPDCNRTQVEPIELNDALLSPRNRMPVPGTATIVGFHCDGCGCEWPVYNLQVRRNG